MSSLLNRAAVKQFALDHAARTRQAVNFTRVSKDFLEAIEAKLRVAITERIHQHPSKGTTLK
jgi:hypothetical protein